MFRMLVIKNRHEIEKMKRAGRVHQIVMEEIRKNTLPGVTTLELDTIAFESIQKHAAIPSFKGYFVQGLPPFPGSICASVNEEVIHGIPSNRILNDGDIISVDLGVFLDGYHADGARTFSVGTVGDNAKKLIEVTEASFFEALKFLRPGNWLIECSAAIQDYVESNGYSIVRDFVGHGIGESMHEEPQIPNYRTRKRGPKLEPGMALAIEPMVNEGTHLVHAKADAWDVVTQDGKLSAHYENTVVITEEDPIVLTLLEW